MRITKIALGILIVGILVVSGVVLAAANNPIGERVYVLTNNSVVKVMLGVNHQFPGAFSTKVSPQLKAMRALGLIKTEPVQIYEITGKPVCGDGTAHPSEQCGEPGLGDCPTGYVCENCKCVVETAPAERTCYPNDQTPWGIDKIYGDPTGTYIPSGGTYNGSPVKVAVLDTGVYRDHLDLKDNIVACKDTTKKGIKNGCKDGNGHGTHVAGTILANGGADSLGIYGVVPEAKLMAIKVCGNSGFCWGDDIAAGIRYAADNGANIVSMSLGGDNPDTQILSAVDYAVGKDVLVVAAAGNDGPDNGSIDYPGAYVKVIAAGAIDVNEQVPDWSSRGINPGEQEYVIEEREVEFGTPGVSVESTYNDGCYAVKSGTSMATPHVSGLAAKLWQGSASSTRSYLQERAKLHDLDGLGDDPATGFGLPIAP